MKYSDVIKPEYIENYSEMQKAIFIDLNSILFDIVFLKKAIENKEINLLYDSQLVIEKLFKNEFQYLIIKVSRCLFDIGSDTITLPRFKNMVLKTFLKDNYKQQIFDATKNVNWNSNKINQVKNRVKDNTSIFRNSYLAHNLLGKSEDISVSLIDIETLFYAASELFELLSFEPADLYKPTKTDGCTFIDEEKALIDFCDMFFDYQYLSSPEIEKISCEFDSYCDNDEKNTIQKHLKAINDRKK